MQVVTRNMKQLQGRIYLLHLFCSVSQTGDDSLDKTAHTIRNKIQKVWLIYELTDVDHLYLVCYTIL